MNLKIIILRSNSCKDYLLKTAHNWEWSVNWLKKKMLDSNFTSWTLSKSNEDSESRTFQRTKSAQVNFYIKFFVSFYIIYLIFFFC